ncbi:hypothetical protein [Streptomyces sp. 3214.6]|uniref:hypothetical protein n=1 Tax=Streptomyces sp. 3214.6 TaxID=1882757 RepID=UPI0013520EF5|nr:hypothetical protein [Streptomyces sp. 3214.6]
MAVIVPPATTTGTITMRKRRTRRSRSATFSAMATFSAWPIATPPWVAVTAV